MACRSAALCRLSTNFSLFFGSVADSQSVALRQCCPFFEFFWKKGHDCNASSGQFFAERLKSRVSSDFRPANPVKSAPFPWKNSRIFYGKPHPPQKTEELGAISTTPYDPQETQSVSASLFRPNRIIPRMQTRCTI